MPSLLIKIGGAVFDAPVLDVLAQDSARLLEQGWSILWVHGGGPQVSQWSQALGLKVRKVGGRRITDEATLQVVKMVLGGQLNIDLTAKLSKYGIEAVGLSGISTVIRAVKRPPRVVSGSEGQAIDFGWVGDIVEVRTALIHTLWQGGYLPILNTLGIDHLGRVYNINADIAANQLARALAVDHLCLVSTGIPGVLADPRDPHSKIDCFHPEQARQAIATGVIQGGMIPKIEESLKILGNPIGAVHILGDLNAGDLEKALQHPGSVGTVLLP